MAAVMTDPGAAKAATLTPAGEMAYFSFPIEKVEDGPDGEITVTGKATDGTLDSDLQVVDPAWSEKALREWFDTGANLRVQHQAQRDPAGRGTWVQGHQIRARVVEPVAVKLVRAGVLQDFSIGIMNPDIRTGDPRFRHLDPHGKAVNGIITGREDGLSKIGEVSLVDRGSNFSTKFALVKAAADGTPEHVSELTAPDDVIARVLAAKVCKTVSVDLPKSMRIKMSPAQLAKMSTLAQRNAVPVAEPAVPVTEPAAVVKAAVADADPLEGFKAAGAAEDAALGKGSRTFTAEQRREHASSGLALEDGSYPMPDADAVRRAATLIRSKHGDWKAAARLLARRVKALGIPNPLKKKAKTGHATAAKAVTCGACEDAGLAAGTPCTSCKAGRKTARALVRKALAGLDVTAGKKQKVMCGHCGAKQNARHVHCPECGNVLQPGAMPVRKNHDFACLGCGRELDKGEKYCPDCGRENPGYLPLADLKIPANKNAKERVSSDDPAQAVTKAKKKAGKKNAGKGNPSGAKDAGTDDAGKGAAVIKGKGKKKGGKGRSPATGHVAQETTGLPAHREPGGAPVEAFEADLGASDGDHEMKAAMRVKALGIDPALAAVHNLTCPAFRPADVTRAMPWASFASIDTGSWQKAALDAASGADMVTAMAQWNTAAELSRCAVTLKTADPQLLHDLRLQAHAAFTDANADLLKAFRDATPGPGSYPSPSHPMPGQFRRPYISPGHAAPSPQHDGARTFPVTEGTPVAADYQRGHLTAGHAAGSPQNSAPRQMPQPAQREAGRPESVHYQGTMAANARQSLAAMHDHVAHRFPDICPMSPDIKDVQKPGHPVPEAAGGPVAGKSAKAAAKAAKRKMAARRRALERKVLKGAISVEAAQAKLGIAARAAAPQPPAPVTDAAAITAAVRSATAPLLKRQRAQDKALRRQGKVLSAIASSPDTSAAPFRGAGVAKSATASPVLAGPVTAAQSAVQAQTAYVQRLHDEWRNSYDPAAREAAYRELTTRLGINPMTGTPDPSRPFTT